MKSWEIRQINPANVVSKTTFAGLIMSTKAIGSR